MSDVNVKEMTHESIFASLEPVFGKRVSDAATKLVENDGAYKWLRSKDAYFGGMLPLGLELLGGLLVRSKKWPALNWLASRFGQEVSEKYGARLKREGKALDDTILEHVRAQAEAIFKTNARLAASLPSHGFIVSWEEDAVGQQEFHYNGCRYMHKRVGDLEKEIDGVTCEPSSASEAGGTSVTMAPCCAAWRQEHEDIKMMASADSIKDIEARLTALEHSLSLRQAMHGARLSAKDGVDIIRKLALATPEKLAALNAKIGDMADKYQAIAEGKALPVKAETTPTAPTEKKEQKKEKEQVEEKVEAASESKASEKEVLSPAAEASTKTETPDAATAAHRAPSRKRRRGERSPLMWLLKVVFGPAPTTNEVRRRK